jgi:hypothetical protein
VHVLDEAPAISVTGHWFLFGVRPGMNGKPGKHLP